jgi:hypothetical protein
MMRRNSLVKTDAATPHNTLIRSVGSKSTKCHSADSELEVK